MRKPKKETVKAIGNAVALRQVTFFVEGETVLLAGSWEWELHTDAVFCSDVMTVWPQHFSGTKGIVHPDDKPLVQKFLSARKGLDSKTLDFRIITTYGEIKALRGERLSVADVEEIVDPTASLTADTEKGAEVARELQQAEGLRSVAAYAGRLLQTGLWHHNLSTGQTWYADEVYRILGLPPQSLNAHLNTLYPFIHNDDRKDAIEAMEQSVLRQVPLHIQFRLALHGDAEKWVELTTRPGFNNRGEAMVYGLLRDVSRQNETELRCESDEAALAFQKQLLHFAEGATGSGYWQVNLVTKKVAYSDNHYRLFGLKPQDKPAAATTFYNLVHPDDRELYEQLQARIRKERTAPEVDYRIIRPDGKLRYIRQKGKAFISGAEMLMAGTVQDITVQKGLEKKLADLQEKLEVKSFTETQAEDMGGIGTWVWNLQTAEVKCSDNFFELLGVRAPPLFNQKALLRAVHPEDQKLFSNGLKGVLEERQETDFGFRLIRRGEVRQLRASFKIRTCNGLELFIGTLQDLTSERLVVQSLAERIRLMEKLADTIPDQVFVTDADNNIALWNRKAEEVYGHKREKVIGENLYDVLPALKHETVIQRFNKVLAGEEVRSYNQQGLYVLRGWFNMTHTPLKDDAGTVNGILHLIHDVTAEHQLHHQLTTRLHFIEQLLAFSADRVVALDRNMNYLYWNKKAETDFGLSRADVIGKNILEIFPQSDGPLLYADFRRAVRGEPVFVPATEEKTEESNLVPIKDERGEITAVLWVQHDRKKDFLVQAQAQKALDIINALNENYLELDRGYRVIFVNRKALDYFGKEEKAVQGKVLWQVYPQLVDTPLYMAIVHAMEEGAVVRREFKSPLYHLELLVSIAPTADGIAVAFSDISFIKQAEQKLAEEHRQLKEAQAIGRVGSFEWTVGEEASQWSDELFHIHGLQPGEIETTLPAVHSFIYLEDKDAVQGLINKSIQKPGSYTEQHRITRNDGETRWVSHQWESLAGENGAVVKVKGIVQDVTERRKADEEILRLKDQVAQKAEEKFQTLFNSIDEGFVFGQIILNGGGTPVDYRILEVNPAYEKMTGLKKEDVVAKTVKEITPGIEEDWIATVGKVATTGESLRFEGPVAQLNKWYETFLSPAGKKADGYFVAVFNDITERKRREEQQEYLLKLSDALRPFADPLAIQQAAMQLLGNQLKADRVVYADVEDEEFVLNDNYVSEAAQKLIGRFPFSAFGSSVKTLQEGQLVSIDDVNLADYDTAEKEAFFAVGVFAVIAVPLIKNGQFVGDLSIHQQQPRHWRDDEIALVRETAERIWATIERAKAEQALQKSEEAFRSYVAASSDIVYKMSADWKTMHLLEGKDFLATTADASTSWMESYIPLYERDRVQRAIDEAIRDKKLFELEHEVIDVTGKTAWTYSRAVPRLNESGEITEWIGAASNVTDRKGINDAMRRSEERLQKVISIETVGVLYFSLKGGIHDANAAFERMSGWSKEDLAGGKVRWDELTPPDFMEATLKSRDEFLTKGQNTPYEKQYIRPDGSRWWGLFAGKRLSETECVEFVLDITEQKEAKEKLKRFSEKLEQQVAARTGELKESQQLLAATFNGSLDYIQVLQAVRNEAGDIVDFVWILNNKSWEEKYGDVIGQRLLQKSPKAMENGMLQRYIGVVETGRPNVSEFYYEDGDFVGWFKQAITKLDDGVLLTTEDVSERKRLEEAMKQRAVFIESVIDASIDQITIFDRDERFLVWNKKAEEAGGLKREEVIGKTIAEVFPNIAAEPEFIEAQRKAVAGEYIYIPAKRGIYSKAYQQWFYVPLKNEHGDVYAVMNVIHDITDKVESEEKLKQQNRELEAKNEEITNFAFIASHDLKEPIRKIHTFSNWLMEQEAESLSSKGKEYAFKINNSVRRLDGLINDITTLTKLQAIRFAPTAVNLNVVVAEARAELQEEMENTGAVIESRNLPTVIGDQKQLVHLFRNLLSNGLKFQQPDVVPVMEITCEKKQEAKDLPPGNWYELAFTDNGIGFDVQYAEKIFRVFQRLHGQSQYPGTGIGLAICKKIMENHRGGIRAQSTPGKGSVFTCWFPVLPSPGR